MKSIKPKELKSSVETESSKFEQHIMASYKDILSKKVSSIKKPSLKS